jgi:diguanylate cyclase (GGDEF)-like protein
MPASESYSKETLESQVRALTDLIEVSRLVVSTIDLDTVLQSILTNAMHFAATPAGTMAMYDEKKKAFILHSCEGFSAEFAKKDRWDVMPGGLTEQVVAAIDIFFIEDVEQSSYMGSPVIVPEGIKALICVPLRVKEEVVGILHLGDFVPRRFDREKMKLLSVFSSFASMAIYNANIHSRTKILAITDSLTGLHNHRYFHQVFNLELRRAKRYHKSLAILMIDVDNFKQFNDKYGHAVGDRILAAIGKIITKNLRKVDFAFRYGGEEFIVLLPEAGLENALNAAERLRETIERETAELLRGETREGVTVSIGIARYPENGTGRVALFNIVDDLLYKAKLMGKNKVHYQ